MNDHDHPGAQPGGSPDGQPHSSQPGAANQPTRSQVKRWRRYLANERAEAAVYRELAHNKTGEEREILLRLAEAETRHESYWHDKLGEYVGMPRQPSLATRFMGLLARRFGSVFVLAMMQTAETRTPYVTDEDASAQIAADERIHAEVVRGLASRGRESMSGDFRAAVFGANDGLVSNLALVLGVLGSGMSSNVVLLTGVSGLLSGALSMAAGEYISVRSQTELLEASTPHPKTYAVVSELDVDANELALVYRARGMDRAAAEQRAREAFERIDAAGAAEAATDGLGGWDAAAAAGTSNPWTAALSSFLCFASGALVPVLPFLFGAGTTVGAIVAVVLVSLALMFTGGLTGVLSGKPPLVRAVRQLAIGLGAAGVTWALGRAFGAIVG
ncbi:VIT1/CCC1 transporter family protein [Corynebacterium uberis]|uniref:VIT1/CCC1 transporter family protein n=1 Tax=Corynebacterium TaxID=1716 RepID=UPI001D0AA586|nr:VIT1/CCC1 transporter family protein [Corynebacterium uberis]MCZ9308211.1 VIT1/CCC1 transporter family protein [Corynebacterium sp. c6VSa_13]UDL73892.1 VIT1/CCC1 transporter family protein [Corynebacterium uberis]UDL75225.1 VIT1/CCC1 transporter family protein [Corynebacterium uberis]UDL77436.1 VIT1/CCC1 transporter family protein [Corynebacterium uberis]UDL79722.1 VIT1/CCC1 transporter family protein [Corynebacterium uberis]